MSEYIHIPLKLTISLNLEPCLSGKLERAISLSLFKGLFIYWLHWVFDGVHGLYVAAHELSLVVVCGLLTTAASHCAARALGLAGSVAAARRHGPSSCGPLA